LRFTVCFTRGRLLGISEPCVLKNVTIKTFNPGELEPVYKRTTLVKTIIENDVYPYKIAQSNANYLNYTNLNHKIYYELIDKTDKFSVSSNGIVTVLKSLDYEKDKKHILHIKASNEANSDKYATQRLIIYVEDHNDNHPIFTNPKINGTSHWQYMVENKTVLKIEATDPDASLTGKILYCWEITTVRKYLKITKYLNLDPNTGIVTTKSAVEKTKRSKLSFKNIWVIAYETEQNILRKNKILLNINLINSSISEITTTSPTTISISSDKTTMNAKEVQFSSCEEKNFTNHNVTTDQRKLLLNSTKENLQMEENNTTTDRNPLLFSSTEGIPSQDVEIMSGFTNSAIFAICLSVILVFGVAVGVYIKKYRAKKHDVTAAFKKNDEGGTLLIENEPRGHLET